MKKSIVIAIIILITLSLNTINATEQMDAGSRSSILMDVNTSRVLYGDNIHMKLPMASTTKILTALLAIENADLNDIVCVSKKAALQEGSSVYLKEGERLSLNDLLYCLMLKSGNDAAVAIAEHISGSVENFSILMNNKAIAIGAKNSNFTNPHGLPNDNHYTTSYDLALIARAALKEDVFSKIVSTKQHTISRLYGDVRVISNGNKMLTQYPGADGVKTGYTKKAGPCLVSSATKEDWQILSVVLNSDDIWYCSKKLLDYGFKKYDNIKVVDKKLAIKLDVKKGKDKQVEVVPEANLFAPLMKIGNKYEKVKYVEEYPNEIRAPIKKNDIAGVLKVYVNNFLLGQVNLLYNRNVESSDIIYNFKRIMNRFLL